jgi:transketolase
MADTFPEELAAGYDVEQLAVNTIRTLAIDAVQKANSGHPGMPLGAAPMAHVLWTRHLRFDPADPAWADRDRFILSAGHGSMLLYALLHLSGYEVSIEDLENFRQWGSRTPGHPEYGHTPGVETTTGPLGAGFSNGVGMAIAEAFLAATFNRPGYSLVDHRTFAIVGDGDLMEGISSESASIAGHLGLGKLIYLYDDNRVSIEGCTDLTFTEDVTKRFEAVGWQVLDVADGTDLDAIDKAIAAACFVDDKPSLIRVRTTIGFGSPNKAGTAECHGSPLGKDECVLTKQALGWPADLFFAVPGRVGDLYRETVVQGAARRAEWMKTWGAYAREYPDLAAQWTAALEGTLPEGWKDKLPRFTAADGSIATRSASGKVLNALAPILPTLMGGSADLAPSNNTLLAGLGDFQRDNYAGRNVRFGVREHAMGGVMNGMAVHGGVIPYGATFFVFSDYMRPAIRLAALSRFAVTYVFTHDSIGLGEDGPTHQPVEHLASLRAMPGLRVIRPSDAAETVVAWQIALERRDAPTALVLTRQTVPVLDRTILAAADGLARGGYVLKEASKAPGTGESLGVQPDAIIVATGSEVHLALEAAERLQAEGIAARVVALPCWELFESQDQGYRESVLPGSVSARVSIEAACTFGWDRYVGKQGIKIGLDRFGASAPAERLYEEFGITTDRVVVAVRSLVGKG